MINIRIHLMGKEKMVAACDSDLLGKRFKEGKLILYASKEFYGEGFKGNGENLREELAKAVVANLVGDETVSSAIQAGFIDEKSVIKIQGVPHAQYLLIR